ncbi:hypothetical protein SLA2020_271110 [Shorea laevis]
MAVVQERRHLDRRLRFTSSSATILAYDLEKLLVLGHGNGGTVYKARHKRTNAVYALKVVQGLLEDGDPSPHRLPPLGPLPRHL